MTITVAHITPLVALIAGILILIFPRIMSFVVAIYLIIIGLIGLNNIHHFISSLKSRTAATCGLASPVAAMIFRGPGAIEFVVPWSNRRRPVRDRRRSPPAMRPRASRPS